jgi:hypothetical protein
VETEISLWRLATQASDKPQGQAIESEDISQKFEQTAKVEGQADG